MKKIKKLSLLVASALLATSLGSCSIAIEKERHCISHTDKGVVDGYCDNCGEFLGMPEISNVEKVEIKTAPTKTYYAIGEELDVNGGMITVTFNDGTPAKDIPMTDTDVKVVAPDMTSKGEKMVLIKYKDKSASFIVEAGDPRYDVSFDLGYAGAEVIPTQVVTIKNKAEQPATPSRAGYDFLGWYADKEMTKVFDFNMVEIMADTVIYAKWSQKFTVTYSYNYEGGKSVTKQTVNGKVSADVVPEEREGFKFAGWYADAAGEKVFSFDQDITADTTIYAKWVADSVKFYTVTFNENYGETPATTTAEVADGSNAATPASPTRAGVATKGHQVESFNFGGWYIDKECKTAYDFNTPVKEDITLYAKWTAKYIFEAEHISFMDDEGNPIQGMGASGGSEGPNMVDSPAPGQEAINPSNGFYVTYLYKKDIALKFVINSDRDVDDATLIFRISCENVPYILTSDDIPDGVKDEDTGVMISNYTIKVNGTNLDYGMLGVLDAVGHEASGGRRPFSDFVLTVNLKLKKGENVLSFITTNQNGMGGTMQASAPVIDCIKIETSAELSWNPLIENEFGQ